MNRKRGTDIGMNQERQWHLDRRVPLALIATIAIHTGAIIWFGASLNERVSVLERAAVLYAPQQEKVIRIEGKVENIERIMLRLERIIEAKGVN